MERLGETWAIHAQAQRVFWNLRANVYPGWSVANPVHAETQLALLVMALEAC